MYRRLHKTGEALLAGDLEATGEQQRALDTAAFDAARSNLQYLLVRLPLELAAELLNRAPRAIQQSR